MPAGLPASSAANFHCAPAIAPDPESGYRVGAVTATASFRFSKWIGDWFRISGARIIIGKGGMNPESYREAFVPHGAIYLTTVGYGTGALLGRGVKDVREVHWREELGLAQAMWVFAVENIGPPSSSKAMHPVTACSSERMPASRKACQRSARARARQFSGDSERLTTAALNSSEDTVPGTLDCSSHRLRRRPAVLHQGFPSAILSAKTAKREGDLHRLNYEQLRLQKSARLLAENEFCSQAAEIDRTEEFPWNNVKILTDAGFMGMTIPAEYGGKGRNCMDTVLVIEQMARCCAVTGRIVVEANLGAIGAIMAYGTDRQKRRCAPFVLEGDKPAICITDSAAGSAATEMTTTAVKKADRYILNGTKHWITGGGVSRIHLIFAQVIEDGERKGIGGFIAVRGEDSGLKTGRRHPAMGLRGMPETEVIMEELEVSEDMSLRTPDGFRTGFASLMTAYNGQRVGAAAVAHGIAAGAYEAALAYARSRIQFGRPIAEFQGIQWKLADMATALAASQALIYKAAGNAGTGFPDKVEAAQAKLLASETAIKVTNEALQIHGAAGYSRDLPIERMVRDARMFTIGGGTAEMLRNLIAGSIVGTQSRP